MSDDNSNGPDSFGMDEDNSHSISGMGTVVLDTSSPIAMYDGLVATLGVVYGNQMFSNLTGIHVLNGKLLPSGITEFDILH